MPSQWRALAARERHRMQSRRSDTSELTLEEVLTGPDWLGLTTATPLQRAICRIADGLPIDDLINQTMVEGLAAYPEEVHERASWQWCFPWPSAAPRASPPSLVAYR